jgi:hypothetical protein
MVLHGSTLDSLYIKLNGNMLTPAFFGRKEGVNRLAGQIEDSCNSITVLLIFMQEHLWSIQREKRNTEQ